MRGFPEVEGAGGGAEAAGEEGGEEGAGGGVDAAGAEVEGAGGGVDAAGEEGGEEGAGGGVDAAGGGVDAVGGAEDDVGDLGVVEEEAGARRRRVGWMLSGRGLCPSSTFMFRATSSLTGPRGQTATWSMVGRAPWTAGGTSSTAMGLWGSFQCLSAL